MRFGKISQKYIIEAGFKQAAHQTNQRTEIRISGQELRAARNISD